MVKRRVFFALLLAAFIPSVCFSDESGERAPAPSDAGALTGVSIGQASAEDTREAVAHFARARSLLIAAINEFDKGRKIANPNFLIDPVEWRNTLIDRAEDLVRVLDPQPRATNRGIKFEADPRLLPEANR